MSGDRLSPALLDFPGPVSVRFLAGIRLPEQAGKWAAAKSYRKAQEFAQVRP